MKGIKKNVTIYSEGGEEIASAKAQTAVGERHIRRKNYKQRTKKLF